ncbi:MAG: alpha/beta hydrolase-fold protein [Bacteroidota bacterium]
MLLKIILLLFMPAYVFGGTIVKSELESKELNRKWKYSVYLPDDYNTSGKRYPVIYLLHGNGDDENAWSPIYSVVDSLVKAGKIEPLILVTPTGERGWWVNSTEKFESAVINELIPEIDAKYFTTASRKGRMIAGYSMGGFGALRYGLVYSELFSACAIFSPALYNEEPPEGSSARTKGIFGNPFDIKIWNELNYPVSLKKYLSKTNEVFFFIGTGDDDWNHTEGKKYNVEYQTVLLYQQLRKQLNIPAELRIINGSHSWKVWKPLFTEAIQLMQKFESGDK